MFRAIWHSYSKRMVPNFYRWGNQGSERLSELLKIIQLVSNRADWLPACHSLKGFPESSVGKEPTCNVGDPSLISGLGRSPGEGKRYPPQCSWASLVAQLGKNLPAMQETWVWSLGSEDPLEKGKAMHSSVLAWRIPKGCKDWTRWVTFTSLHFTLQTKTQEKSQPRQIGSFKNSLLPLHLYLLTL